MYFEPYGGTYTTPHFTSSSKLKRCLEILNNNISLEFLVWSTLIKGKSSSLIIKVIPPDLNFEILARLCEITV